MYSLELLAFLTEIGARKFLYPLIGTITPLSTSGSVFLERVVQNDADFLCLSMSCTYQTKFTGPVDDGVNRLTAKFKDGGSQITLVDDFVDLATIASPGRQRSVGLAGDPSQGLNIPGWPWLHLYPANGAIQIELRNSSTQSLDVSFTFDGFKVPREMRQRLVELLNPMREPMPG